MTDPAPTTWSRRLLTGSVLLMLTMGSLSIAVSQILLGVALFALVAGIRNHGWPRTGLEWPSVALLGWAVLMVPFSSSPGESAIFLRRFYVFFALWTAAAVAVDEGRRRTMFLFLAAGAVALSGWSLVRALVETGNPFGRRMGEMSNPMTSGCLLMIALLVALAVIATPAIGRRLRLVAGAVAVPVLLGLVQTITRSAWLGLVVGVWAMATVIRPRRALVYGGVGLGLLAAVVLAPDGMLPERIARRVQPEVVLGGRSTGVRLDIWRGGLAMVKARPLTGVGDCSLDHVAPDYYGDEATVYHGHMHSNPLMFAVIWGLPGFVLAMGWFAWQLVAMIRRRRLARAGDGTADPWAAAWLLGAVGAWAGFFTAGFTEWYFGDAESLQFYLLVLGTALGAATVPPKENPPTA